jgi:hypothetical protein
LFASVLVVMDGQLWCPKASMHKPMIGFMFSRPLLTWIVSDLSNGSTAKKVENKSNGLLKVLAL